MAKKKNKAENYGGAIYLSLNGNNWAVNNVYLMTAIHEAHEYGIPLYVTGHAGGPNQPPPCPPGQICS